MKALDNTRGLRRIVRRLQRTLRPVAPFGTGQEGKGAWQRFTQAPQHVWRRYDVSCVATRFLAKPIRIAVLSDLHVGSHAGDLGRLARIVAEVRASAPDVVLLPGDFVNMQPFGGGRISHMAIANLLAPLRQDAPVFAVLGNHDAEYGNHLIAEALDGCGIRVLLNENIAVSTSAGLLHISGLADFSTGSPDTKQALSGIPPESLTLVLAHDPASFADIPIGPAVTISGHTHGGQIRLPIVGAVANASSAPMRWTYGHVIEDGRQLIVSAGIGTSGLPWRFNCPPEIVEVRLIPADG